jgi:hypothetical protein
MKRSLLLFLITGITFLSCTQSPDDSIVSAIYSADKSRPTLNVLQTSALIDGEAGGEILYNQVFVDNEGRNINVFAWLRVLPNSFSGSQNITMILNPEDASVQFLPEMVFNRSVRLNLSYTGLELKRFGYTSNENVDFVYFNCDGKTEIIENTYSKVRIDEDNIRVENAKLLHFSRYGWIR